MHPLLLPGTHLLRRDAHHLQVGLSPGRAVVVPAGEAWGSARVTQQVVAAGLAWPDDAEVRAALPPDTEQLRWQRHSVAARARELDPLDPARPSLADLVTARRHLAIDVRPLGHRLARVLRDDLADLCGRVGLGTEAPSPARRPVGHRALTVLLSVGELRRSELDALLREGAPHLLVQLSEGDAVLGPLVVPGHTACGRCVDAHHSDVNPAWPLLVEQQARASACDRSDGIPEPVDPALVSVLLGWTVREMTAFAESRRPMTWSATVRISSDLTSHRQVWRPHSSCGCSWA